MKYSLSQANKKLIDAFSYSYDALQELVESKGGFIDLQSEKNSTIHAYSFDLDFEEVREYDCIALRIIDGDLECFIVSHTRTYKTVWTKDEMYATEYDGVSDNWHSLSGCDGTLYACDTMIAILTCIEEYI